MTTLDEYRRRLKEIVLGHPGVLLHLEEPIELAGGDWSTDFVDAKLAVEDPVSLRLAGEAMAAAAHRAGARFDVVGGMLVGAAPFTFAVAQAAGARWFLVRKEPKGRGTNRWTEGARLAQGTAAMVVDDVVTKGGSIIAACQRVEAEGAKVVFATALVDRADVASAWFAARGIAYDPILTYRDLGIAPVGETHGQRRAR
jgi:orotate phosphoribosyltransferase